MLRCYVGTRNVILRPAFEPFSIFVATRPTSRCNVSFLDPIKLSFPDSACDSPAQDRAVLLRSVPFSGVASIFLVWF